MEPFALWLLGGAVIPDAYERVVDRLCLRSAEDRLAKSVWKDVGGYPKRVFRRWYRAQETWDALVEGGQQSFDSLVDRLVATSGDRFFGSELPRDRAEAIVRAVVNGFMGSLDPSEAVNVADYRSAQRDRLIDENAESRTGELREHLDMRLDGVEGRLDGAADFDRGVAALPGLTRPFFEVVGATREALLLLDIAAAKDPREALVELTADIPSWLRDASAATLRAAAELCHSYRVHLGAAHLLELAADRSPERGYLYARAAVELGTAGEPDRSNELIGRATSLSTSTPVRAIAAALAEDPRTVLEVMSADDALQDPHLVSVHLYGLRATSAFAEVIPFLTAALEVYPETPGLMIELAWAYLKRSQEATTSRTADRDKALELGLEARRLRREWRLDAADAARVACQAALSLGAYDRVIRIGMAPPDGEARPGEAANLEVRLSVAQAAVARGNVDLLRTVVDLVPEGFHRAIIQAELLMHSGADAASIAAAYDAVWAEATEEEHRVLYWLSAAAAGVDLHGKRELRARTDDVPVHVDALLHIARGEQAAAITLLRQSRRTEHTTRLLVGALIDMGDIDGAVDELKIAANRFNDTSYLVRAVEVLGQANRLDDAASLAEEALQRVPRTLAEARAFLHEVLIERAGVAEEWGDMAVRSRAWIEDLGSSPRNRWHLALALHQGGDPRGSWRILQEPPALEPSTASQARLWTVLAAREAPSPDVADRIVALVDAFPDDKALAGVAVTVFFGRGDAVWGDVRPETVTRYQDLLTTHALDYGSHEEAAIYVLTGTTEEMLERLRPSLEANAQAIEEMTEKVRQGWPYGLLASVAHRPYAAVLLQRAAGWLPIATVDAARAEGELEIARAFLGKPVVVDVSTLVIGGHLRRLWPQLRASYARLELPRPAHHDILNAVEGFRLPSQGTLYFDPTIQAVRGADADPAIQERLLDHGEWVAAQVVDVVVADWPHLVALSDEFDDTFFPWLSTLDMAKARELPLWCDDLGLRTLATSVGVPTFGTTALIAALASEGKTESGAAQGALRQLRQEYAVDLPLDADWLHMSAASDDWRPGPAAFYFSRPAAWLDFEVAHTLWSELARSAAATEPIRVAGWVHAAAYGFAGAVAADKAATLMAVMAVEGVAAASFDGEAVAACAARVREVALAAGLPNPVPAMMAILLRHLTRAVGPEAAARLLMSPHLADPDRVVVRDLVFGPRSGSSPLDP
jgi:tetratricopeptide (TPR) repeat protein